MRSALRPLTAIAAIAAISLSSAGCSDTSAGTGAHAGSGNTGAASTSSSTTSAARTTSTAEGKTSSTPRSQAVKFAECMRTNGVSGFPDPDASGSLTLDGVVNGSSVDANSASWKRAIGACQKLQPAGFTGKGRSALQQQAALKFAQCVREHGVPDFPDPAQGQPLIDTNHIPSSDTSAGMSILNAATGKCGKFAGAAGITGGR